MPPYHSTVVLQIGVAFCRCAGRQTVRVGAPATSGCACGPSTSALKEGCSEPWQESGRSTLWKKRAGASGTMSRQACRRGSTPAQSKAAQHQDRLVQFKLQVGRRNTKPALERSSRPKLRQLQRQRLSLQRQSEHPSLLCVGAISACTRRALLALSQVEGAAGGKAQGRWCAHQDGRAQGRGWQA